MKKEVEDSLMSIETFETAEQQRGCAYIKMHPLYSVILGDLLFRRTS